MSRDTEVEKWTVLLVDDEDDNLEVARKVLTFFGAQTHIANDGIEGLKALETLCPTLILLDLSMPRMDGFEMLKRLRENPQFRDLTVIALTAHAMNGDRERVMAAGFNGYIAKPFRIENFLNDIKDVLRASRSAKRNSTYSVDSALTQEVA
jgi:CheY-like chemotaxis protein